MGIYDREYYRDEPGGFRIRKPGTVIGWIIIINVIVFLADEFLAPSETDHWLNGMLGLQAIDLAKPWLWWKLLTYGFCHGSVGHIFGNMIGLFFLGPPIEQRYGKREFLRLYLAMIVFAGAAWAAFQYLPGGNTAIGVVGASGAVVGVIILFALNYPKQTVLLMMVFPMPAWVLGVIIILGDLWGSINPDSGQIAFQAHLAGAGLAFLYWRGGWNFTRLTDKFTSGKLFQRRPRLKVHHPEEDRPSRKEEAQDAEVDRVLDKLHREGEASLTRKERRTLQNESRRLQQKRRDP